jgi:hypothetical protein
MLKQLRNFLFCGMAVKRILKAKLGCPKRSALAARQNFGWRDATQHLRVSNRVGGRVNSVNTGFGPSGKDAVSLGDWFLVFRQAVP